MRSTQKYIKSKMEELNDEPSSEPIGWIGIVALKNRFDRVAPRVLIPNGYIRQDHNQKRGTRTKYHVLKELPSKDEYNRMRDIQYGFTALQLIEDAYSEIEGLKHELQDWYDNLPDQFQSGQKGDELQEAIDQLEGIEPPCVPEEKDAEWKLFQEKVVFLPLEGSSRSHRLEEAVRMLKSANEVIQENKDTAYVKQEIESTIENLQCVEFPGMF